MLTLAFIMVALFIYTLPGFVLARGMYAQAVKEISSRPVTVVPKRPERPELKLNEMLHVSSPRKCAALSATTDTCNCRYRSEWIKLKNGWLDYDEWNKNYGHIKNGVTESPEIALRRIYLAVPLWPLVGGAMYIKGGAKGIPDYREIERMESELRELD